MAAGLVLGAVLTVFEGVVAVLGIVALLTASTELIGRFFNQRDRRYGQAVVKLAEALKMSVEGLDENDDVGKLGKHEWSLIGDVDGCLVKISSNTGGFSGLPGGSRLMPKMSDSATIRVFPPGGQSSWLCFRGEGLGQSGIQTGDSNFDSKIRVFASERTDSSRAPGWGEDEIRARLSDTARFEIDRYVMRHSGQMTAGVLSYTDDHLLEDVSRLKAAVSAMARVQRAVFHRDFEVVKSLLSNAKTDSDSEVRFTNFKMLIDDFGSSAETADAAQHLLTDSSPKLRLLAAATIGDPCHAKVKSEFESLRAMDFVTKNGAGESALMNYGKWLVLALRRVDFPGREEALRDVLGLAIEMHSRYINSDTGYVLAQAGRETACGAMDALGEVGTAASVETLLQFSSGFLTEAGFKKAANGAIASIQSRVQGADAGQLMLSGADLTDAGQLALSSNDGELALTPEAPLVESD